MLAYFAVLVAFVTSTASANAAAAAESMGEGKAGQPNIVLVVSDDLGFNDVGFHGSEIETPFIDSLAHAGVILDHYYGAYARCCRAEHAFPPSFDTRMCILEKLLRLQGLRTITFLCTSFLDDDVTFDRRIYQGHSICTPSRSSIMTGR